MRSARSVRRGLLAVLLAVQATGYAWAQAPAASVKLLVQSSPLAGFRHHEAAQVWPELRVGDALDLVREPANPHDGNAVRVEWRGRMLGYVPRAENAALAWAMDRGETVSARISRLGVARNSRKRLEFEVFAE
jgi:hypothetical protein